jgi:predicted MFS family arabinose efflux permease
MHFKSTISLPAAFNRLVWSNLAAQSAEQIALAATPIVAVLALNAGAGETGLLHTAQTLPFLLLSIPTGLLADRTSRRRLLVGAELLRVISFGAILTLLMLGRLALPMLALFGFVSAAGTVASSIAAPSLVLALVPGQTLAEANRRIELTRSAAFVTGPVLAGMLIGWGGAAAAFVAAVACSAGAVALLAGLYEPVRPAPPPRQVAHELKEGAAFVFAHPLLRPVLLTAVFFVSAFFVLQAVYVPYAIHRLGLSPAGVGATLATAGAGMVVAALLAPRVMRVLPFGAVMRIGPLAGLAGALVMVLTIWAPVAPLAGLSFFLFGAGPVLWTISALTLRQIVTPEEMLGRVSAIISMTTTGSGAVGATVGALVGGSYGAESALVVAALGFLVQALLFLTSPVARLKRQPEIVVQIGRS